MARAVLNTGAGTRAARRGWPLLLVAALLLLLAGAGLGRLGAPHWPGEGSRELSFVRDMSQHHLQAVSMAGVLYRRTADPQLRALCYDILTSQADQVGQMRGWLSLWGQPWGGQGMTAAEGQGMGMATPAQVASLAALPVQQAERQFLTLMIRHHTGALAMARPAEEGTRPEVAALARQIVATQSGELSLMRDLLAARGGSAPDSAPMTAPMNMNGDYQH